MVTDEQIEAMVEARLESMGLVPSEELVAAVIDIAWDIATEDWPAGDDDEGDGDSDEAANAAAGMDWGDYDETSLFSLVAEEG